MAKDQVMEKSGTAVGDALDRVRAAAQELHHAISDTLATRTSATKAEVDGLIQKAKDTTDSAKSAMRTQQGAVKQHLTEAIEKLEATQKHAAETVKSSGQTFHASVIKALTEARASAQKISEAVAARRSEEAAKQASAKPAKQA